MVYDPSSVLQDAEYAITQETQAFIAKLQSSTETPDLTFTYVELFTVYKNTFAFYETLQAEIAAMAFNTGQQASSDITNDRMTYFYNQQLSGMQANYASVLKFYWLFLVILIIIYFNYQTLTSYKFLIALVAAFLAYPLCISLLIQYVLGNYYNHNVNNTTNINTVTTSS